MYLGLVGDGRGWEGEGGTSGFGKKTRGEINKGETGGNGEGEKGFQINLSSDPPPPTPLFGTVV